jgi:hypothetical protein
VLLMAREYFQEDTYDGATYSVSNAPGP